MQEISQADIEARLARDNPWWKNHGAALPESNFPKRVYFDAYCRLALNFDVKRASILLGPRRVGKTVMIKQVLASVVAEQSVDPTNILYASIDTPLYSNISLSEFLKFIPGAERGERCLVAFDEIQYLKDWQAHLKDLVDAYPNVKFIASGSAAAALSLQSKESGAGRFSDFMLPPLTFAEFLLFSGNDNLVQGDNDQRICEDIDALNGHFIDYLNFGGYPEAVLNDSVRNNPEQFIRVDIIEKVLLKDLPSLYGISDIQELNKLFMFLAYNAGQEASYENISQTSGLTKQTIKRYIEYLESAFLIIKLSTTNQSCKSMQRERNFKIYLNNPSMRAALFRPVRPDEHTLIGHLAESAVFSQWQHSAAFGQLRYARWRGGEVDAVYLDMGSAKPLWIGEVKWSDAYAKRPDGETRHIKYLLDRHSTIENSFLTTRTVREDTTLGDRPLRVWPTALYCYMVGSNVTSRMSVMRNVEHEAGDIEVEEEEYDL